MPAIWTIGHSNKPIADFIDLLKENGIEVLIDVRSRPSSRWCPQYNRANMEHDLEAADIHYIWKGANLGGLQGNVEHELTLDKVASMAASGRVAVCCSEAEFGKCHRNYMLTPAFQERGLDVIHIQWKGLPPVPAKQPKATAHIEETELF